MYIHNKILSICIFSLLLFSPVLTAQQIRVGTISNSINNWPLWVADTKGFFEDEGLEVLVSVNQDSGYQLDMLASGKFEFTHQAADHFVREIEYGREFVVVHIITRPTFDLIIRPEYSSYAELKGKTVALDNTATGYWLLYKKVLEKNGVSPGDYALLANLGGPANRLKAVRDNRAQFTHMNAPASIKAEMDGFTILTNLSDHYPEFPASSIGARRDWAEDNRELVVAYLRAYVLATEWLLDPENRDEAIDIAVAIGHERELLPGSFDRFVNKGLVRFGTLSEKGFTQVGELLIDSGVVNSAAGMEKYADPSYQQEARKQLFEIKK